MFTFRNKELVYSIVYLFNGRLCGKREVPRKYWIVNLSQNVGPYWILLFEFDFFPILAWFVQVFFVSDKFKILNLNSMVTGNYVIWRVHSSLKLSFGVGLGLGPRKSKASS